MTCAPLGTGKRWNSPRPLVLVRRSVPLTKTSADSIGRPSAESVTTPLTKPTSPCAAARGATVRRRPSIIRRALRSIDRWCIGTESRESASDHDADRLSRGHQTRVQGVRGARLIHKVIGATCLADGPTAVDAELGGRERALARAGDVDS